MRHTKLFRFAIYDLKIRSLPRAIAHHAALQFRQNAAQHGIVVAGHDNSVERHAIHEFEEGAFDVLQVAIAIHVLAVDVGDDRNDRRELQKRAVTLVGLGDEILRPPQSRVRSHRVHAAANDNGWIEAAAGEHSGNHGSGRGLAMHAADGDAVFQAHQFGQHFGALDDRNMQPVRLFDFGIARLDC